MPASVGILLVLSLLAGLAVLFAKPQQKHPAGQGPAGCMMSLSEGVFHGRMTASITWITPFFALMSVFTTLASPVAVPTLTPPSVETFTTLPPAVLASVSFTTSAA